MRCKVHWDYIAILALLGVVVPWNSARRIRTILQSEITSSSRITLYLATAAFQLTVSAIIAWRCMEGGLNQESLGLRLVHPLSGVVSVAVISGILVTNQWLGVRRLSSQPPDRRGRMAHLAEKLLPRTTREKIVAMFLVTTVALCEEFIYRGFIEAWFQILTSSAAAGAVISAGFFAVAHSYQGRKGVLVTFLVGFVFSWVRIWTNSLLPSVMIHLAVDLSAGLAFSRMLRLAEG